MLALSPRAEEAGVSAIVGMGASPGVSNLLAVQSSIAADASFVTPGNPQASRLYTSITSGRMPLGNQPSPAEISRLEEWITSLGSNSQAGPVAAHRQAVLARQSEAMKIGKWLIAVASVAQVTAVFAPK